jgi:putative MATE family efflux protein
MKNLKTINFLEGKASKNLTALFVPLLISFFFSMAFDINDSLWIGNLLGEKALAAQTVSMPLILIYNSVCMGVTGGISILLSQAIGAKVKNEIDRIIATSFVVLLAFSLILTLSCEAGIDGILSMLNTPTGIYAMAKNFLMIHILSFPFVMLYMYFCAVLRSYGNSSVQLIAIIGCTLLNVGLDPLFIHFMGMSGVALATVISEGVMMALVFAYCKKNKIMHINIRLFCFSTLRKIVLKAVPAMIQQSLPSISAAFVTSLVAAFGIIPIAAYGTATRIETLLLYPPMAMNMALTSATGQCFGANNTKKAKEYSKWGVLIGCGLLAVLTLIVTLFARNLAILFGVGTSASQLVSSYFIIIAFGYVCNIITNSMLGTINGAGKPAAAMCLMIFYYIVVRMPLAKILSITLFGLNGIWIAVLISHIAATIASILYYRKLLRQKVKTLAMQ